MNDFEKVYCYLNILVNKDLVIQRLQACSFLSASFRDTQVLSMEALSLHHTRWLVRPKICAANWAVASGETIVEQPRPARGKVLSYGDESTELQTKRCRQRKCLAYRLACGGMTRRLGQPSLEWEVGSWWQDMLCFQTSPGPGHYFCQLLPQKQWERHPLLKKTVS